MTKNITLNESARERWQNLVDLVFDYATKRQYDLISYIHKGYFESWAPEHRNDADRGIKAYSTDLRWKQYQDGKISREKAVEYAIKRAENETLQALYKNVEKLNAAAAAEGFSWARISVEWKRSRTWGANPTAKLIMAGSRTTGSASGCGYDKESAAIAEALNENPAALAMLYDLAEKALCEGKSPASKTACTGFNWSNALPYGSGYTVLPYFEGGVGSSCYWEMFKQAGYIARCVGSGKMYDCYEVKEA